jgi:MIP family channel proteins
MANLSKALVAEFIGTFALILLGAGSGAIVVGGIGGDLVAIALAHGLTIMIFAYAFGHISGTHINPAVTLGLVAAGKFEPMKALYYIIVQIAGAIVAGFVLLFVFGSPVGNLGATHVNYDATTMAGAFVLEMIGTFFLVNTVLNAAVSGRGGNLAPLAIGLTVTACIVFFGPLTGASVNPARTIGPAVAAGYYVDFWMYLVAPPLGGILAGLLYRYFLEMAPEPTPPAPPIAPPNTPKSGTQSRRR